MIGRRLLLGAWALACTIGAAQVAGAAVAGQPIGGLVVRGGCTAGPDGRCPQKGGTSDRVIVTLNLGRTESWTYEPVKGTLTPSAAARSESAPPVKGVGIVVKKNPGGGASRVVPVGETGEARLPALDDGSYDLSIRVPNASLSTRPRGGGEHGVELTFTLVKRGDSLVHVAQPTGNDRGSGSPKQQGF